MRLLALLMAGALLAACSTSEPSPYGVPAIAQAKRLGMCADAKKVSTDVAACPGGAVDVVSFKGKTDEDGFLLVVRNGQAKSPRCWIVGTGWIVEGATLRTITTVSTKPLMPHYLVSSIGC